MLKGKNITFSYSDSAKGKIQILKDISFHINKGDIIGLIGASGSGKTTFIKHLNGLLKADCGEIFFEGENIYEKNINNSINAATLYGVRSTTEVSAGK